MFRSSRAYALQHDSTAASRDPRRRHTAPLAAHGAGATGNPNLRPHSDFRAPESCDARLSPATLLTSAWRCVVDLRIDDALAIVAQFEEEIVRAGAADAPRSREVAGIVRSVLLVLKNQSDATARAAIAGFLSTLHEGASQDSVLLPQLRPCIESILVGRARQRTRALLAGETAARLTESLSPREHSILHSMSQGLSNKRIAQQLQIAPETVKSHVKRIFVKLAVQSRAHAVSTASALGML